MAETHFSRPAGGVCHFYARHTENYIVLTNELLTRATIGLTVAMGMHILSAPEGTPVTIESLCARWSEGRTRMRRALRELEEIGFLERRVEQGPDGRWTTRTIIHHRPRDLMVSPAGTPAAFTTPAPVTAPPRAARRRPATVAAPVVVEWVPAVPEPLAVTPAPAAAGAATVPGPAPMSPAAKPAPAPAPESAPESAEPPSGAARPAKSGVPGPAPVPGETDEPSTPTTDPATGFVPSGISCPPVENTPRSPSRASGKSAAPNVPGAGENGDTGGRKNIRDEDFGEGKTPEGEPLVEEAVEPLDAAVMRVVHALRRRDPRLVVSERECRTLAPGITAWLDRGMSEAEVARALCQGLPTVLRGRAAGILAWRLRAHLPPPTPAPAPITTPDPAPAPGREKPTSCRGCHNVMLRPESGLTHCRACREAMARQPAAA
ncbi:hypothetical protein [Streptomyces sp. ST2-7A]|uniref:hypothetical protein n=1 Tax=Streptomyces sp. ST2-7A TaxID=2907214 RepID=UPI001F1A90DB|nr:hypothetical protein [Streptomyces sp. ST2-7A]MCE7080504.1 hypothetical protein [Streptomyces sp. ST2-7A]